MPKLIVFNHVSLDGYFTGPNGDLAWAYRGTDDPEYGAFVAQNASGGGRLLLGRITYDMMVRYWTTPEASRHSPAVAEGMNRMTKLVFSRTLENASWSNTKLLNGDPATEVRRIKSEPGPGIALLGSGQIVAQLATAGLIDEYQFVVDPVVLGGGRTMFAGLPTPLNLDLTQSRTFANGKVYLCYRPVQ
ncbi:MAG: dihydrofolate reductase [Acidobacteria bacterium]|nr:dihydrofolate reductase [Acidobacteriota bacterium]